MKLIYFHDFDLFVSYLIHHFVEKRNGQKYALFQSTVSPCTGVDFLVS